jgi:hypothetical protein
MNWKIMMVLAKNNCSITSSATPHCGVESSFSRSRAMTAIAAMQKREHLVDAPFFGRRRDTLNNASSRVSVRERFGKTCRQDNGPHVRGVAAIGRA